LDASCEAFPAEPEFLFRHALVLLAIGREAEARDALGQAHGLHPVGANSR
jgi:Flp pilus assembly protein TadD